MLRVIGSETHEVEIGAGEVSWRRCPFPWAQDEGRNAIETGSASSGIAVPGVAVRGLTGTAFHALPALPAYPSSAVLPSVLMATAL